MLTVNQIGGLLLKSLDETGRFSGYASVFNVLDAQREMVAPGAFYTSLKQWEQRGRTPSLLWQHHMDCPIGHWETLREDKHGLWGEGRLLMSIQKAQEAYELLKAGAVRGLSIGFRPIHAAMNPKTKIRTHYQVDLVEISLVTLPANREAQIQNIKKVSNYSFS